MRIGILQTDSVREEFRDAHGDYPGMFRELLLAANLDAGERPIEFRDYDVQSGELPADPTECDAYVITGSRDSVYDDKPWIRALEDFVRELHVRRHKLVGICFGHQLVAQALDGATSPAEAGWAVGVHGSRLVRGAPWMDEPESALEEPFALISSHKDQVTQLPTEAELLATNDFCPNAAFTVGDHILCIQGHPEFRKAYSRTLMDFRREILGEDTYVPGVASLEQPIHPDRVGRWMLSFMQWRPQSDRIAS